MKLSRYCKRSRAFARWSIFLAPLNAKFGYKVLDIRTVVIGSLRAICPACFKSSIARECLSGFGAFTAIHVNIEAFPADFGELEETRSRHNRPSPKPASRRSDRSFYFSSRICLTGILAGSYRFVFLNLFDEIFHVPAFSAPGTDAEDCILCNRSESREIGAGISENRCRYRPEGFHPQST